MRADPTSCNSDNMLPCRDGVRKAGRGERKGRGWRGALEREARQLDVRADGRVDAWQRSGHSQNCSDTTIHNYYHLVSLERQSHCAHSSAWPPRRPRCTVVFNTTALGGRFRHCVDLRRRGLLQFGARRVCVFMCGCLCDVWERHQLRRLRRRHAAPPQWLCGCSPRRWRCTHDCV